MGDLSSQVYLGMFRDYFLIFRKRLLSLFSIHEGKNTTLFCRIKLTPGLFFLSSQVAVTDDCPAIHVFCAKLEYLLLFGLKPVGGIFSKKPACEYFSFLRQVTKHSKQLIDGLRYINLQNTLKTDLGRGRGLLRYYLSQNCLADLLQTITT
jgi:hypothetical protein